jgi:hypothetical protein
MYLNNSLELSPYIEDINDWQDPNFMNDPHGIELKNMILKSSNDIYNIK